MLRSDRLRSRFFRYREIAGAIITVAWACRVSVIGLVLPSLLLISASQARDLFSFFAGQMVDQPDVLHGEVLTIFYWSVFNGLTMALWCYPVHFSARVVLYYPDWLFPPGRIPRDSELRRMQLLHRPIIVWLPRLLGASVFLAAAWACHRALDDVPSAAIGGMGESVSSGEITGLLWFLQFVFVGAAIMAFIYLSSLRAHGISKRAPAGRLAPRTAPLLHRYRVALGDQHQIAQDVRQGRIWLTLVTIVLLVLLVAPSFVTARLFLALVFPVVAGAWVPFFTWLAILGHRHRLPLIFGTFALVAGLAYLLGDNHDVTRASSNVRPRLDIAMAIDRWKAVNCTAANTCPQPIIVASAGGASRAAFFTVTVLGDLMDHPGFDSPDGHAAAARHVVNQVFAISGVSGGSVGAAFFSGAVANSDGGTEPCAAQKSLFWFRGVAPDNWRSCLQAMVAEDFLSETIVGLSFRDNLNFLDSFVHWPDRAAILEQSWATSFAKWVRPANGKSLMGLDQPFTAFGPSAAASGQWEPLLILNGTSVTTGRRILTSHLEPVSPQPDRPPGRIFKDSYDLFEILSGRPACREGRCDVPIDDTKDVTLASAATNSARFPIISPSGTLKRPTEGDGEKLVDRIVDGGYFENDGVTTTIDLVNALRAAGLHPAVIHIANDPLPYPRTGNNADKSEASDHVGWRLETPALPTAPAKTWLSFLAAPVSGLYATRGAHATYALSDLEDAIADRSSYVDILVFGEPIEGLSADQVKDRGDGCLVVPPTPAGHELKAVSMSWWLSQPVQEYLDAQLRLAQNCDALARVRSWLK